MAAIPHFATVSKNSSAVPVSEFRERIQHLERSYQVDRCSCVGAAEKASHLEIIRRIYGQLLETTCKRAKSEDWIRRERIIDTVAEFIIKAMG
jgi:hypothetical protein